MGQRKGSMSSITCTRRLYAIKSRSKSKCHGTMASSPPCLISGTLPSGMSGRPMTCSACASRTIRIIDAFCCRTIGKAIRCSKTIRCRNFITVSRSRTSGTPRALAWTCTATRTANHKRGIVWYVAISGEYLGKSENAADWHAVDLEKAVRASGHAAVSRGALGTAPQFPHATVCEYGRLYRLYTVRTGLSGAVHLYRDDQGRA